MNDIKLFIDDFRDAPEGWSEVRKVESAIRFIAQFSPTTISIDHDIENRPSDETFKPVAYFIGQKFQAGRCKAVNHGPDEHDDDFWFPKVIVHSDNPVGAKEIQKILEEYGIFANWVPFTSEKDFKEKYGL